MNLEALPAGVRRLVVAFSGGVDSSVLLHLLLPHREHFELALWHVHHGLQPNADAMAELARRRAAELGIDCRVDHLDLEPAQPNLEAAAREARYRLFASGLDAYTALLTAHHRDDQAETLLLNLLRGSGPAGLAGIAARRPLGAGWLLRPMLDMTRAQIERIAGDAGLEWVEDPSNAELHADRNFLRHRVLPLLTERWPRAAGSLAQAAAWQSEARELQDELASIDAARCLVERPYADGLCAEIPALQQLSPARQKNLLRHWLRRETGETPSRRVLEQLLEQGRARADAQPLVDFGGRELRRYRGAWYIMDPQQREPLPPAGGGEVRYLPSLSPAERQRYGHRLKRLFQQAGVPSWMREQVPLRFEDDELKGIG